MEFYYKSDTEEKQLSFAEVHAITLEHDWLNTSDFYTVTNKHDLRLHFTDHPVEEITFVCADPSYILHGFFFNRTSDKVVICIPPFGAETKDIIQLAGVYHEYDVLLLEYKKKNKPFTISPFFFRPSTISMLAGAINQAFSWVTHRKTYKTTIAHAQCYGAWLLLETQSNTHNTVFFDKIILDSCPLSLYALFENMSHDPISVMSIGKKESPSWMKKLFSFKLTQKIFVSFFQTLFTNISASALIKHIQAPILFITGSKDFLVHKDQFETLFNAVPHSHRHAFITPFKHLHHSLKSKELYRHYILNFVDGKK